MLPPLDLQTLAAIATESPSPFCGAWRRRGEGQG